MAAPKRRATYEDLMQDPDTRVAEILDGELFVSPRPASPHAWAGTAIGAFVHSSFHGDGDPLAPARPGGWWIVFEPELHFVADVLVPDIAGWRRERMPSFPLVPYFTLAPDWVCEVVSPSTGRIDRSRKMRIYGREGVAHLWLVDPLLRTVEAYRRDDGGAWIVDGVWDGDQSARIAPFTAAELPLARFWPPEPPATT
jgi:Uma2 family endonuclease